MDKAVNREKVVVAMSGGVDSSVAAYLLKEQGFDVIGVSLDLYDFSEVEEGRAGTCCSLDDIYDARKVCDDLGIPHYVFNYREVFENEVIHDFLEEYGQGRTPNPCIICNDIIKFNVLLGRVHSLEANYLATGHYARIEREDDGSFSLLKGRDVQKDQSYFLYRLGQDNLPSLIFPCGNLTKKEVREIAMEAQLGVKDKEESQEICFIPAHSYKEFLAERGFEENWGEIVDLQGRVVGNHRGIFNFTVGQRRGLGLSTAKPYYVVHIDGAKNRIVVGCDEDLYSKGALVDNLSFVQGGPPSKEFRAEAKVRYRSRETWSTVRVTQNRMEITFETQVKSVTPGQALVLYQGDKVMGGGIISEGIVE